MDIEKELEKLKNLIIKANEDHYSESLDKALCNLKLIKDDILGCTP